VLRHDRGQMGQQLESRQALLCTRSEELHPSAR